MVLSFPMIAVQCRQEELPLNNRLDHEDVMVMLWFVCWSEGSRSDSWLGAELFFQTDWQQGQLWLKKWVPRISWGKK